VRRIAPTIATSYRIYIKIRIWQSFGFNACAVEELDIGASRARLETDNIF
jgi:hypothetical protein